MLKYSLLRPILIHKVKLDFKLTFLKQIVLTFFWGMEELATVKHAFSHKMYNYRSSKLEQKR